MGYINYLKENYCTKCELIFPKEETYIGKGGKPFCPQCHRQIRTRAPSSQVRHQKKYRQLHPRPRQGRSPTDPDRRRRQSLVFQMLKQVAPGRAMELQKIPDIQHWVTYGWLMPEKLPDTLRAAGRVK